MAGIFFTHISRESSFSLPSSLDNFSLLLYDAFIFCFSEESILPKLIGMLYFYVLINRVNK